jgi:hypothetical protein
LDCDEKTTEEWRGRLMWGYPVYILDYKWKWQISSSARNGEHLVHLTSFVEPKSTVAGEEIYFE